MSNIWATIWIIITVVSATEWNITSFYWLRILYWLTEVYKVGNQTHVYFDFICIQFYVYSFSYKFRDLNFRSPLFESIVISVSQTIEECTSLVDRLSVELIGSEYTEWSGSHL